MYVVVAVWELPSAGRSSGRKWPTPYNMKDEILVRTTFKVKIAPEFIIWFPNKAMRHSLARLDQ